MGIWDRLRRRGAQVLSPAGRAAATEARALEDDGRLLDAASAFEAAGEHLHAIRVMLALADEEPDARARVRLLGRAARIGAGVIETPRELRVRYAKARLDLAALGPSSSLLPSELSALGRELSAEGEHGAAAEAFRLAGDARGAAVALAEAGEIERLEGVLESENDRERRDRTRAIALAEIEALEASGQRLAAVDRAAAMVARGDQEVEGEIARITRTLVPGPDVTVDVDGVRSRWVLGAEVVLGRVDCGIVVPSPVVSRRHLSFLRGPGGEPLVQDLQTRNGSLLGGARLAIPLAIHAPLVISLGGEIDVSIAPADGGGLSVDVGGASYRVPLGPACIGPWRMVAGPRGVRLEVPSGAPPPLLGGKVAAAEGIDLAAGDVLTATRAGGSRISVLA